MPSGYPKNPGAYLNTKNGKPHYRDTRFMTIIQRAYYDFIMKYMQEHGVSPSYDEIAANFGVDKSVVARQLRKMVNNGHIIRRVGDVRRIILVKQEDNRVRELEPPFKGKASKRSLKNYGYDPK